MLSDGCTYETVIFHSIRCIVYTKWSQKHCGWSFINVFLNLVSLCTLQPEIVCGDIVKCVSHKYHVLLCMGTKERKKHSPISLHYWNYWFSNWFVDQENFFKATMLIINCFEQENNINVCFFQPVECNCCLFLFCSILKLESHKTRNLTHWVLGTCLHLVD